MIPYFFAIDIIILLVALYVQTLYPPVENMTSHEEIKAIIGYSIMTTHQIACYTDMSHAEARDVLEEMERIGILTEIEDSEWQVVNPC